MKNKMLMIFCAAMMLFQGTEVFAASNPLRDLAYLEDEEKDHLLDVWGCDGEIHPVIVEVHGGGFFGGKKESNDDHSAFYADNGFAVVTPNYTHMPDAGSFDAMVREVISSLCWVEEHAEEYGFDTEHVFLSGDSAGAYLANLSAVVLSNPDLISQYETEAPSFTIKGCVLSCPEVDILALRTDLTEGEGFKNFMAKQIGEEVIMSDHLESNDLMSLIDPETYPPVIVVTTPDDDILYNQAVDFDAFLSEKGIEHDYLVIESTENDLEHAFNTAHVDWSESLKANEACISWLKALM